MLLGPFVDLKNNAVTNADKSFSRQWLEFAKTVAAKVENMDVSVIMMSSARDAMGYPVYPQPAVQHNDCYSSNMKTVSDPAVLDIGGVQVAVTSTDILFHLGKEEISYPPRNGDRMSRLASHLLQQGSMYPLYPASEEINLDLERLEQFGMLDQTPHIMLLPSDLNTFVREVSGVTVINPGRLTKGSGPGTYSLLKMRKGEGGKLETRAEIIRI